MADKRAAVIGLGNIGKACIDALNDNIRVFGDFEIRGAISRDPVRASAEVPNLPVYGFDDIEKWKEMDANIAFLCGGSKNDLFGDEKEVAKILANKDLVARLVEEGGKGLLQLGQGPFFAQYFPVTLDTFDTHPRIEEYHDIMDAVARPRGHLAVISDGWDPGTFSDARISFDAYAIGDKPQPFYGLGPKGGKSMGHSNALLTIPGVKKAIQYTHAIPEVIERARKGEKIGKHEKTVSRKAIVVLEKDTPEERARVEPVVKNMKDYFEGYATTVAFVDDATFDKEHAKAKQHDGVVIATGKIGPYLARHEFSCAYESNAHGTAGIVVATARGAYRLWKEGKVGACIISDIPATYRSGRSRKELLKGFM